MASQQSVALLIFVGVILMGLVVGITILPSIRQRRWQRQGEELEAFLTNISKGDEDRGLSTAPAVVFKKEDDTTYVDEPVRQANITVHVGTHPKIEIIRRLIQRRRAGERLEPVRKDVPTSPRGIINFEGRLFLMTNWKFIDGKPSADLMSTSGQKVGTLQLTGRDERVILGSIHLSQEGKRAVFDVFIPINHPNATNLFNSVKVARPVNKELAVSTIMASYNNTPVNTTQAVRR